MEFRVTQDHGPVEQFIVQIVLKTFYVINSWKKSKFWTLQYQFICIFFAICYSSKTNADNWELVDVEFILRQSEAWFKYYQKYCLDHDHDFKAHRILHHHKNRFDFFSYHSSLIASERVEGAILQSRGFTMAFMWGQGGIHIRC